MLDLTGGLIDFAFLSTVQSIAPVAQNQARALAVGTETRIKAMPEVPTLKELGYGDVVIDSWFGLAGPKNLPPEIVKHLNAEVVAAANDQSVRQRAEADDLVLLPGPPEAVLKLLRFDYERVSGAVKRLDIKPE